MTNLLEKYRSHKSSAKRRGIDFDLSFEDWLNIWDGHHQHRGVRSGEMGMCRTRDEGGYTLGNVRIATVKENAQEAAVAHKVKTAQSIKTGIDYRVKPPVQTSWTGNRHNVFKEYVEEDE